MLKWPITLITLVVKKNKIKSMAKAKKKAAPKKEVAKKKVIKTKEEGKPAEVKAVSTHVEVPYVPRKIDRLPADLNKLKK